MLYYDILYQENLSSYWPVLTNQTSFDQNIFWTQFLPHSAPFWILNKAENLASSSLQDWAMKWLYFLKKSSTHPPDHLDFFFECCAVSPPQLFPHQQSMRGVPPPPTSICFPPTILFPQSRKYVQCPPSQYMFFFVPCPLPNVACQFSCQSSPTCISECGNLS